MGLGQSSPRQHCQAIIEGIRCIRNSPVAEFKITVGDTAICITLCESCRNTLADEHSDWMFTQLNDFPVRSAIGS